MNTVKDALAQKSGALIHVRSGDMVVEALRQMRDNRVRSPCVSHGTGRHDPVQIRRRYAAGGRLSQTRHW